MKKIKGIMAVVGILMVSIMLVQSWAQLDCWKRITNCIKVGKTVSICCPTIREEVKNERDCFCSLKPALDQNVSTKSIVDDWLSTCDVSSSIDTLCTFATTPPPPFRNQDNVANSNPHPNLPPPTHFVPPSPPLPNSEPSPSGGHNLEVLIPAIVVPIVSVILAAIKLIFYIRKKRNLREGPTQLPK